MKRVLLNVGLILAVTSLVGCIESTTVLTVEKDGSGMIAVREFMSPQITSMMEGMAGMGEDMAAAFGGDNAAAKPKAPANMLDMFKDSIEKKTKQFGEDVELVKSTEKTNKKGWKGYEAFYSFKDVNKLKLAVGDADMEGGGMSESSEEEDKTAYRFEFAAGDPATLKIIPIPPKAGGAAKPEGAGEETAETEDIAALLEGLDEGGSSEGAPPAGMGGMEDMGGAMMAGMMGPMLQGMRISFFVQVKGEIQDTNAEYRSEKIPNILAIMDVPMDKLVGNAEAMKMMSSEDPETSAKLKKLNIPGVKIEDPTKTITVSFK